MVTADEDATHRSPPDPVRARRARWARWASTGTRVGYGLVLVAMGAFVVGVVTGFGPAVTTVVTASLLATTVTLAPGIVMGYAVRAAEREDREHGR